MKKKDRNRGMALVVVLMLATTLLIILVATLSLSSRNALLMANHQDRTQALLAAEAGVARGIYELEEGFRRFRNY